VLSKPKDLDEARNMPARLSGRTHTVMTGLAVADTARGVQAQGCEQTQVTFRELSSSEIDRFVEAVNPVDRAGAYTVDGPGSLLVKRYEGCYHNVLGFPLVRLDVLLRDTGHSLFDWVHGPRSSFL
jgi:septum formation protein